jgi:hypothetical protein
VGVLAAPGVACAAVPGAACAIREELDSAAKVAATKEESSTA